MFWFRSKNEKEYDRMILKQREEREKERKELNETREKRYKTRTRELMERYKKELKMFNEQLKEPIKFKFDKGVHGTWLSIPSLKIEPSPEIYFEAIAAIELGEIGSVKMPRLHEPWNTYFQPSTIFVVMTSGRVFKVKVHPDLTEVALRHLIKFWKKHR